MGNKALDNQLDQLEKDCELIVHSLRKVYKQGQITFASRMLEDVKTIRDALEKQSLHVPETCKENTESFTHTTSEAVEALMLVNKQAEDDGLWFHARNMPEAYLQQELRKLHRAVERPEPRPQEDGIDVGIIYELIDDAESGRGINFTAPDSNGFKVMLKLLKQALTQHEPQGYVLVPIEPTAHMMNEGGVAILNEKLLGRQGSELREALISYKAMIQAARPPEADEFVSISERNDTKGEGL